MSTRPVTNILITLGLFLIFSSLIVLLTNPFKTLVVDYYPKEKLEANRSSLVYQFNRNISVEHLQLIAEPEITGQFKPGDNNKYFFNSDSEFPFDQKYTISIYYKNHLLLTHAFTTPTNTSSQEALDNNQKDVLNRYPLATYFPYEDENMILKYAKPLTISVVVKQPNTDIRKLVNKFMLDHNVDPKTHSLIIR